MTRAHLTLGLAFGLLAVAAIAPVLRAGTLNPSTPAAAAPSPVLDVAQPVDEPAVSEVDLPELPVARPKVDLVICLDTSDSMEALIDSTRAQIWDVVSRAASAEPTPEIRVGLVTYGTQTGSAPGSGNVIVRQPLTADLDAFYTELMALQTRGRDEYVGWAVDTAVTELDWAAGPDAARMLIVAGNESALQGPIRHHGYAAADRALRRGIRVHTMYAGDDMQGRHDGWSAVAQRGGGRYSAVDVHRSTTVTATPYDAQLTQLNDKLNQTYVPYGGLGATGMARLRGGDGGATATGALSARVTTKASAAYRNADWDLVDALDEGADLAAIPVTELPPEVAEAAPEDRRALIEQKKTERDSVRAEIASLARQRRRWLRKPASAPEPATGRAPQPDATTLSAPAPTVAAAAMDDALEAMVEETMLDAGMAFAE